MSASRESITYWLQALDSFDKGDANTALKLFGGIKPATSKVIYNIGSVHAIQGDYENAIEFFKHSIESDRYLAVAYFQIGVSRFLSGSYKKAASSFNSALKLLRGNSVVNYQQLGLDYKLYSCEIMYNRALSYIYSGQVTVGIYDLGFAVKEKRFIPEHAILDEALGHFSKSSPYRDINIRSMLNITSDTDIRTQRFSLLSPPKVQYYQTGIQACEAMEGAGGGSGVHGSADAGSPSGIDISNYSSHPPMPHMPSSYMKSSSDPVSEDCQIVPDTLSISSDSQSDIVYSLFSVPQGALFRLTESKVQSVLNSKYLGSLLMGLPCPPVDYDGMEITPPTSPDQGYEDSAGLGLSNEKFLIDRSELISSSNNESTSTADSLSTSSSTHQTNMNNQDSIIQQVQTSLSYGVSPAAMAAAIPNPYQNNEPAKDYQTIGIAISRTASSAGRSQVTRGAQPGQGLSLPSNKQKIKNGYVVSEKGGKLDTGIQRNIQSQSGRLSTVGGIPISSSNVGSQQLNGAKALSASSSISSANGHYRQLARNGSISTARQDNEISPFHAHQQVPIRSPPHIDYEHGTNLQDPVTPKHRIDNGMKNGSITTPTSMSTIDSFHQYSASPLEVKLKIHFEEETRIMVVGQQVNLLELQDRISSKIDIDRHRRLRLRIKDEDGDLVLLGDQEDLELAFAEAIRAANYHSESRSPSYKRSAKLQLYVD